MLKSQDTLILLKIQSIRSLPTDSLRDDAWQNPEFLLKYSVLGTSVGMSTSQGFSAVQRLIQAGLLNKELTVRKRLAAEWLIHGLKYFQPPRYGGLTRGIPTSYAAVPLRGMISQSELGQEPPPVWEYADGVRGIAFEPIYKTVPLAAGRDPKLYEYLVLLDAIRSGRTREAALAIDLLRQKLGEP